MTTRMLPFQYVMLRCVPRVDREEFVNVGVLLYCQAVDYLNAAGNVSAERLRALSGSVDVEAVRGALAAIESMCHGEQASGAVGRTSLGQRFGWLVAPKSTVIQPGPVHGGITSDPERQLEHLMETLVG